MNRFFSILLSIALCVTTVVHAVPIMERRHLLERSNRLEHQLREMYPSYVYLRALDSLVHLARRNNREFIGWHGTNIDTANLWAHAGKIQKPQGVGESGAGQHLGPGLYVTDDWTTANVFANWNAHSTKKQEKVCAIYAKDSENWRVMMTKVWMPSQYIGDHVTEAERQKYIHSKTHKQDSTTVKFAPLDPKKPGPNQLVIPNQLSDHFEADCVDVGPHPPAGIPTLHYDHEPAWNIHH